MGAEMAAIRFPGVDLPLVAQQKIPMLHPVTLSFPASPQIDSIAETVQRELDRSQRFVALAPGSSVAVSVGSRGIASLPEVVAASISWLKDKGLAPFIVPAMGSHGQARAEGQKQILAQLGICPDTVGAPIQATMETVDYGVTRHGIHCQFDRNAAAADGILVINRVKAHTSFERSIESGLIKMLAVGLGKAQGARNVHRLGVKGLAEVLPALAEIVLSCAPITFGLALLENQKKELSVIEGVEPDLFFETEERLLKESRTFLPRLPFDHIDVLVVVRMGKNISGIGMDYAVTGRTDIRGLPNPSTPFVTKLVVLRMTPESHGNAMGLGVADFTTRSLVESIDLTAFYMNAITATFVEKAKIPMALPTEELAVKAAVASCWRLENEAIRMAVINTTLELERIWVSDRLIQDMNEQEIDFVSGPAERLGFNTDGKIENRF